MMKGNQHGLFQLLAGFVFVLLATACSGTAPRETQPTLCDGIPADMGGCSSSRPAITSASCEDIARDWARAIDVEVRSIASGPAVSDGKQRSSRVSDAIVVTSIVVGMHLNELGLADACDVPEFLATADLEFSPELRAVIPTVLFDGEPTATMDDWEFILRRAIAIIDEGE